MDFDQFSPFVKPHQFSIASDLQFSTRRTGDVRSRVDGIAVVNMMIRMYFGFVPVGDIIRLTIIR